ncbi:hypothetical protein D3C87_2130040 [compost metagenome]
MQIMAGFLGKGADSLMGAVLLQLLQERPRFTVKGGDTVQPLFPDKQPSFVKIFGICHVPVTLSY